jgi:hypothetical protein
MACLQDMRQHGCRNSKQQVQQSMACCCASDLVVVRLKVALGLETLLLLQGIVLM